MRLLSQEVMAKMKSYISLRLAPLRIQTGWAFISRRMSIFGKLRNKPKYQESMLIKTFCFNSVVPIMKKQRFAIPLLSRIL